MYVKADAWKLLKSEKSFRLSELHHGRMAECSSRIAGLNSTDLTGNTLKGNCIQSSDIMKMDRRKVDYEDGKCLIAVYVEVI